MYSTRKTVSLFFLALFLCVLPLMGEEPLTDEPLIMEEPLSSEEESLLGDEQLVSEEPLLREEVHHSEAPQLDESPLPEDGALLSEDAFADEESLLSDDAPFKDEDFLVFEAPPLVIEVPPFVRVIRSFDDIFPNLSRSLKNEAMSDEGLRNSIEKDESPLLIPAAGSGIDLLSKIMLQKPSHIIEALVVVPYNKKELDILDIYNALGRIENIQDHSFTINDRDINIFEETTRIESVRNRKPIPDPPPADKFPYSETMYLRFKDAFFGNLYIRGDISISLYGITYSMTNFTDIRYFLIPIIRSERISIILYLEPVKEGVLIYSMSGFYLPGFIADRANLTPSINRRISALLSWITDGLSIQEDK